MIAALLLSAALAAPASTESYDQALAAHAARDPRRAAGLLYAWMQAATRTNPNYETAEHLLAADLQALSLTHAALVFEGDVIRDRARPELLPAALKNLEEWTRNTPHDEERVEAGLLQESELDGLDSSAQGAEAFVAYTQGALDLKSGEERWARARFNDLPDGSPFRYRARILTIAAELQKGKDVLADFQQLAQEGKAPREVRNEAHIAAGRLLFEKGDFAASLAEYQAVDLPELDPGRGQIYLEEAWAEYRLGHGSRAMGLLAALDAPSFRALFLPEKFLLRALIFKDACQWLGAKRAARALLVHHAASLAAIRERKPLVDDPVLSEAALQKGAARRAAELVTRLKLERDRLDESAAAFAESGLAARLGDLYAQELGEAERRRALELQTGVIRAANELLGAAEQVGLADYEVGLALYRRGRGTSPAATLTFADDRAADGEVAFKFDGEYWNDELTQLRFALVNRCVEGAAP